MIDYGKNLFEGTAKYYSQYRPLYPSSLIRFLIKRFSLEGKGKMLDLGSGTGQLTFRFSDWFEKIIAIDTDPEMVMEARHLCEDFRVENIEFINEDLEKYKNRTNEIFEFVTIAKAFHWLNREETLETLYNMISDQGGIAIIDNYSPNNELLTWQEKVNQVVREWYGKERRAGDSTYSHPKLSHQEVVLNSKFNLEVHRLPTHEQVWSVESIIGNIYSTSYGAKRFLGDNIKLFERHLTEELLAINEAGVFKEEVNLTVILALKNFNKRGG